MAEQDKDSGNGEWYISGSHARRAIGYLGVALVSDGDLPIDFELPALLNTWAEALEKTMDVNERSPIGNPGAPPIKTDPDLILEIDPA